MQCIKAFASKVLKILVFIILKYYFTYFNNSLYNLSYNKDFIFTSQLKTIHFFY